MAAAARVREPQEQRELPDAARAVAEDVEAVADAVAEQPPKARAW